MICQIYPVKSTEEAFALIDAGAEYLGFAPGEVSKGRIPPEENLKILKATEGKCVRVVLSKSDDEEGILRDAAFYRPDVLQLVSLRTSKFRATKAFADKLRARVPGMKFMHMLQMDEETKVEDALRLCEFSDYIILDTGLGATGKTHDWNVSKQIVEQCSVPVMLAGGLGPDNVAEAVRFVKPWGVDSMTLTHKFLPDGSFVKDIDKVRCFCEEAKKAEAEYLHK